MPQGDEPQKPTGWLRIIGPGILVAATGVGAGDLATGALTGGRLGVSVLWAALVGAVFKFVLTEGLARWQLATGETVLEGVARHFGRVAIAVFLAYLLLWTFLVAAALMSASGVAMHAMLPLREASQDKLIYGIVHSLLAVGLVEWGGYRLFERVMRICIGLMFVTVMITAIVVRPDWGDVLRGLFIPTIHDLHGEGLRWTVGLMGGVGGTVTVLCYGYWIREEGRESPGQLMSCRFDLAVGYIMTALFGIAMVIIGSRVLGSGDGAAFLVTLSAALGDKLGTFARWTFLMGAWGAIFSSLLGVWQSVPYLFTDVLRLLRRAPAASTPAASTPAAQSSRGASPTSRSVPYRVTLYTMATVPVVGMLGKFAAVQLAYAVCGALFIPLLAITLLMLNSSARRIGAAHRNRPLTTFTLLVAVLMFVVYGYLEVFSTPDAAQPSRSGAGQDDRQLVTVDETAAVRLR